MESLTPAEIEISDGVVRSRQYGDVYFSTVGGLAETRHVFHDSVALNSLWEKRDHFTIAETGFGTGLNFLATWHLWSQSSDPPALLHYIAIEGHPITVDSLAQCHGLFPELASCATLLREHYPRLLSGFHRIWLVPGKVCLTLCLMEVRHAIQQLEAKVDCWFLDGFSPAKNPDMWQQQVFRGIGRLSAPDARIATFTAAGAVKRGLEGQGFAMRKTSGFGSKRDMLVGQLKTPAVIRDLTPWFKIPAKNGPCSPQLRHASRAVVIGAGIAGAQVARHLGSRGWQVTIYERNAHPGREASGNPAAILSPRLTAAPSLAESFSVAAWSYQLRQLADLGFHQCGFHASGALQLAWNSDKATQLKAIAKRNLPDSLVHVVDATTASELANIPIAHPALHFPEAGWVEPDRLIRTLLAHPQISIRSGAAVAELVRFDDRWQLIDSVGSEIDQADVVIITSGANLSFTQLRRLALNQVKGQTSLVAATPLSRTLRKIIQYDGYLLPSHEGRHLIGATYDRQPDSIQSDEEANERNLKQLHHHVPAMAIEASAAHTAHAAVRMTSNNRQPYVGPAPDCDFLIARFADMHRRPFHKEVSRVNYPGLYISAAHGSRGFTNAALSAEILASLIHGEPLPVTVAMYHSLHPARQIVRKLQRNKSESI